MAIERNLVPIRTEKPLSIVHKPESLQERIRRRAHEIWLRDGAGGGSDTSGWLQAEEEIISESTSPTKNESRSRIHLLKRESMSKCSH
jgi:hypothetical protein